MYSNMTVWDSEHFFKRLEFVLAEHKMSLHELSCRANINISTLYKTRANKSMPNLQTICSICDILGIKLWEFFAHEDEITPEMRSVIADMQSISIDGQRMLTQMVKYIK